MITCKQLAQEVKDKIKDEVAKRDYDVSLGIITVGDDPASAAYVKGKIRDCEEVGITWAHVKLSKETTQRELNMAVSDMWTNGTIVQLPLPNGLDVKEALDFTGSYKDVDGLGPYTLYTPCTALGIYEWLKCNTTLSGKHAVIINRSELVGKPLAKLLLDANCTVTMCHSYTPTTTSNRLMACADIVVVAVGKPFFIADYIFKPGAIVVDVGISRVDGKLMGDVVNTGRDDITLTPVPGGVGLLTRAYLLKNVLEAADRCNRKEAKQHAN